MLEEFVSKVTHTIERKRVLTLANCSDEHDNFQGFLHLTYSFSESWQTINLCMTREEVAWLYDQFGKALVQ